jgi:hypothetical protein
MSAEMDDCQELMSGRNYLQYTIFVEKAGSSGIMIMKYTRGGGGAHIQSEQKRSLRLPPFTVNQFL